MTLHPNINIYINDVANELKTRVDASMPDADTADRTMMLIQTATAIVTSVCLKLWTGKDKDEYFTQIKKVVTYVFDEQLKTAKKHSTEDFMKKCSASE